MKTIKVVGFMVVVLAALPVYAAVETADIGISKTLADFQRDYSGTKPVVAWHKFQEFKMLGGVPRPTLGVSQMRISPAEMTAQDLARGTKPAVGLLIHEEVRRRGPSPPARPIPYTRAQSGKWTR